MARSGVKKSSFIGSQTVPSGSTFDYVYQGQNYKITDVELFNQFGITGLLQQEGDPTGAPILNKSGTVNNIRNIEGGSGIQANISVNGGVELAHNFNVLTSGVPVIPNPLDSSPTVRTLAAGSGINLSVSNDIITIENLSVPTSSKTVTVSSLADLPNPVAGVITLLPDTEYRFLADIDFGVNRIVLQNDTLLRGSSSAISKLTYTGTGDFITATDTRNTIIALGISCPSGTLLNWSDSSNLGLLSIRDLEASAINFGTITGSYSPAEGQGTIVSKNLCRFTGNDGVLFNGSFLTFTSLSCTYSTINDCIDLGSAVFASFLADAQLCASFLGFAVSGLTSSGNIADGGFGVISRILNVGPALNGISVDDSRWAFMSNQNIADTRPYGLLSMHANATNTVISTAGVPVLVAGAWGVDGVSQATGTTSGRVTYDGVKDVRWPLSFSVSLMPVSGTNKTLKVGVAINGVFVSNSARTVIADSGSLVSVTGFWQATFSSGDYVEIFVSNESSTTDLIVDSAVLKVN